LIYFVAGTRGLESIDERRHEDKRDAQRRDGYHGSEDDAHDAFDIEIFIQAFHFDEFRETRFDDDERRCDDIEPEDSYSGNQHHRQGDQREKERDSDSGLDKEDTGSFSYRGDIGIRKLREIQERRIHSDERTDESSGFFYQIGDGHGENVS